MCKQCSTKKPKKLLKLPEDPYLPFFTYGIFMPGQLGHHQISEFVIRDPKNVQVKGSLVIRDGIPLLKPEGDHAVPGYLVHFEEMRAEDAYKKISKMEPDKLYYWSTVDTADGKANVLLGRQVTRGNPEDYVSSTVWSGKDDSMFTHALDEARRLLNENTILPKGEILPTIRLQMAYLLLWASIERYATLKYNFGKEGSKRKIMRIASEPEFGEGLRNHVKRERTVFAADAPKDKYRLQPDNPEGALNYYYQIRNNVVHRGKSLNHDHEILVKSLSELLSIYEGMIKEAFSSESQ